MGLTNLEMRFINDRLDEIEAALENPETSDFEIAELELELDELMNTLQESYHLAKIAERHLKIVK